MMSQPDPRSGPEPRHRDLVDSALQAMGEGVTLADAEGRIVYSNPAADRLLGVPATTEPAEAWAEYYGVFLPGTSDPFPADRYPLIRALQGEETNGVEMLIRNAAVPEGAVISVTGRAVRDLEDRIIGAAVVFHDVTDLRIAEGELRQALEGLRESERGKTELIEFLVHDMKGPLTAIMASAEVVLMDEKLSSADREGLSDILVSARALHRMTLDMLDVQSAEDGHLEPEGERLDARAFLEGATVMARARGAATTVEIEGNPTFYGDPEILRRVFGNLLDNCIRYGVPGGRVWLDARTLEDGGVLLRVRDEGRGVPPEFRERIFEKYTRMERDSEKTRSGSRGLGLRFCKVAVEAHGGRIWVEDNVPKGAAFCVMLPAG